MSKATIVIPNINGKGWLKDSIESIYAQTESSPAGRSSICSRKPMRWPT